MTDLTKLKCVACRGGEPTLTAEQIAALKPHVPEWAVQDFGGVNRLVRSFRFADFAQAVAFTNRVAVIAEAEGHHPLIVTEWGRVTVHWWTHKIRGLHQNDFIMAAKTDQVLPA